MLIKKIKLLILFALISNINIYGGAFDSQINAVKNSFNTLLNHVNNAKYTDLDDYHYGYNQQVNLTALKNTLNNCSSSVNNLSSATSLSSLAQQVNTLSAQIGGPASANSASNCAYRSGYQTGIMLNLCSIALDEAFYTDGEYGDSPLDYLASDGSNLVSALNTLIDAINTAAAKDLLQLSTQLIQTQISALNNYMSPVNNLGPDFQTVFNNINSSTLTGTLSSTLTNTGNANSLISNLTGLIGNNTFGTGTTGLNQGANWWKKPNPIVVSNMQNAAIASQNIITIISNYQQNITTDPTKLTQFVSATTPVSTGLAMSSTTMSSIQKSYQDMTTQLNIITSNGAGHPTDWSGAIVTGLPSNALMTAINNNTATYAIANAIVNTNHNQLINIDDALWNLLTLQTALQSYVSSNDTYHIPPGTTIGTNIQNIINDCTNIINLLNSYKTGAGIKTTVTVNS